MKDVDWATFFRHLDRSMGIYFNDIRELNIEDDGEIVDAEYQLKDEFDCLKNRDVKSDLRLLVKLVKLDLIDKLDASNDVASTEKKSDAPAYILDASKQPSSEDAKELEVAKTEASPCDEKPIESESKSEAMDKSGKLTSEKSAATNRAQSGSRPLKCEDKKDDCSSSPVSRKYLQGSLRSLWSPKLPDLNRLNWIDWSTLLQELLSTYPKALQILLGQIKEGDEEYAASVDEDLYYLLHWKVPSNWRPKVRKVKSEVGPKGSVVYAKLRDEYIDSLHKINKQVFERGENKKSDRSLGYFYRRLNDCFETSEENDLSYTEKEKLDIFVMGLAEVKQRHKVMDMIKKDEDGHLTLKGVYEMLREEDEKDYARKASLEVPQVQVQAQKCFKKE